MEGSPSPATPDLQLPPHMNDITAMATADRHQPNVASVPVAGSKAGDAHTGLSQRVERLAVAPAAAALHSQADKDRQTALADLLEEALLANEVYLRALAAAALPSGEELANNILHDQAAFVHGMLALGFRSGCDDPWRQLGVAKLEGPAPTEEGIQARLRLGQDLLSWAGRTTWGGKIAEALRQQSQALMAAATRCTTALPEVVAERKKVRPGNWDRWQEAEPGLGAWLAGIVPSAAVDRRRWRLLPMLSNELQVEPGPGIEAPIAARELLRHLSGDAVRIADFMDTKTAEGWVLWAPATTPELVKLLTAYRKHLARRVDGRHFGLWLLAGRSPLPVVSDEHFLDLWVSPLWDPKHADVVEEVVILNEPVRCVLTGPTNPYMADQTVAIVKLGPAGGPPAMRRISWQPSLTTLAPCTFVVVDVPRRVGIQVERRLRQRGSCQVLRWEGHCHHQARLGSLPGSSSAATCRPRRRQGRILASWPDHFVWSSGGTTSTTARLRSMTMGPR